MPFHELTTEDNINFLSNSKKSFRGTEIPKDFTNKAFEFAYDMTFGEKGEHRQHRSGADYNRRKGEIFINTFQGKLAEFAVYKFFNEAIENYNISEPDLETYGSGQWDDCDLIINNKKISVKSTKSFGNLLLLETKDFDNEGTYIPNKEKYDFFILTRIGASDSESNYKTDGEKLMRSKNMLYSDKLNEEVSNKDGLKNLILNRKWYYDIPGFITHEELVDIIDEEFILPRNSMLNKYTRLQAENYYVQAGDMHDLGEIFDLL